MARPTRTEEVGSVRASQLVFTFGVGSVVNLPELSVIVLGLDAWPDDETLRDIPEARLLAAVRRILGPQVMKLRAPMGDLSDPTAPGGGGAPSGGVPTKPFPGWMRCSACLKISPIDAFRFLPGGRGWEARYIHDGCGKSSKPTARPVRFLVACERGHLDDFPFSHFVHRGPSDCKHRLELKDMGVQGDLAGAILHCACGAARAMLQAFSRKDGPGALGPCRGRHPHLEGRAEGCPGELKVLLLGTTGSWYSQTQSVLYVPAAEDPLEAALRRRWEWFRHVEEATELKLMERRGELAGLPGVPGHDEIFAAIRRIRTGDGDADADDLLGPEWEAFTAPHPPSQPEFQVRTVPLPESPLHGLRRVRLVERLRAVHALVGFSRLSPLSPMAPPRDPRRAPLARHRPKWVPAAEIRGEGIFLEFEEEALVRWELQTEVAEWWGMMEYAWVQSRARYGGPAPGEEPPPARHLLLHSLSHALARRLAAECGYPATALRERIYARLPTMEGGPMSGLLLYTAAPDSEGTLGGLVALGEPERLGPLLEASLQDLEICASDPLCSEALPVAAGEAPRIAGASCHACLYAPETFCTGFNSWLDRAVLVPTLSRSRLAFFGARR